LERDSPAEEADIHPGFFAGLKNGTLPPVVEELQLAEAARAYKEMSLERPARSALIR
jgi:hypothetical protein